MGRRSQSPFLLPWAPRFGYVIQQIPWKELSCDLHFHTSDSGIGIWYIGAQDVHCLTALTVCYALKIEFWLLKVFLKSTP